MPAHDRIMLHHLDRMTDSTGLLQHASYSVPRRESGYTADDNARALRLCARLWCRRPEERMLSRVIGYLSFFEYARTTGGRFRNLLSYQRRWLDEEGTDDAALAGLDLLGEEKCLTVFGRAHGWFYGQNSLGQTLVDLESGACCDGFQPSRVNLNQGAESTLAYLWTEVHVCDLQDMLREERIPAAAGA